MFSFPKLYELYKKETTKLHRALIGMLQKFTNDKRQCTKYTSCFVVSCGSSVLVKMTVQKRSS